MKFILIIALLFSCISIAQPAAEPMVDKTSVKLEYINITEKEAAKKYELPEELPNWLMSDLIRINTRIENIDALGATKAELIEYTNALKKRDKDFSLLKSQVESNDVRLIDFRDFGAIFVSILGISFALLGFFTYINAGSKAKEEAQRGVNEIKGQSESLLSQMTIKYKNSSQLLDDLEKESASLAKEKVTLKEEIEILAKLKVEVGDLTEKLAVERKKSQGFEEKLEHVLVKMREIEDCIDPSIHEKDVFEKSYTNDITDESIDDMFKSIKYNILDSKDEVDDT
ncbi:hypothetical protein [Vibrio splendidus]|uniref:hypothetical protein n=1 Tax=Vibrio splendidus TaxID=29497 RepID=UPI0006CA0834|nr:hypothetical protein [Vibrio splendidus]KPL99278.1 hypothetical protein AN167_14030 [Vibrio splendidus]